MTETSPTISQTRLDAPRADTSVGTAIPGVEVRIVDAGGADVAPGEPGELWVRGPNVMKGYYREPALTAATMRPGGWLNTGDMARQDPDGALFIVGRTKELIIRSGFNVYPLEVETVLNAHPGVAQSAVVGRAVAGGNEEVVAFVEADRQHPPSVQELRDYLAQRLSPYKCPSRDRDHGGAAGGGDRKNFEGPVESTGTRHARQKRLSGQGDGAAKRPGLSLKETSR